MSTILRVVTPLRRSAALATICLLALPASATAAEEIFEGRADVVAVSVPVTVTTKDGQSMRGLTAEDFTLIDDGERQTITGFEVIDLDQLVAEEGRLRPLEQALPSAARRHFLLLFDISFSTSTAIARARDAARNFVLGELHPTDLVAVATFSMEVGPRLLVTFTPDRAQLARALDVVGSSQMRNLNLDPLRFLVNDRRNVAGVDASTTGDSGTSNLGLLPGNDPLTQAREVIAGRMKQSERNFHRAEITAWSRTLGDLAKALNAVKGRKQVLYFSEGFDSSLLLGEEPDTDSANTLNSNTQRIEQGQNWLVDTDQLFGNTGLQADVNEMLREFRRADCVVQAIDVGGLRAGGDVRQNLGTSGREGLFYMANETGGELFDNANDLEAQLTRMVRRSTVTYLLTFQPSKIALDGAYHNLKVKVDGVRGNRVSHRDGYYAPRPYQDLHPLEKRLLASDAIASAVPRQDLGIDLLAVPFVANEAWSYVPVILEVSGDALLVDHQDPKVNVEIYTYVTNDRGEMQGFFSETFLLDASGSQQALRDSGLKYYGHLDLSEGDYLVRVLVRNADTGRTGVATREVNVRGHAQASSRLLPPLFLDEPGRWVLVKEAQRESRQQTVVYPFTIKGQPYIPAARPTLRRRQKADLCLIAYNLGGGELELTGRILDLDGQEVTGGQLALVERTVTGIEGLDKLLATFNPRGLENGEYTLEVAVRDVQSGSLNTNTIPFSVLN